jgi:hypothetical protein
MKIDVAIQGLVLSRWLSFELAAFGLLRFARNDEHRVQAPKHHHQ